jgi:hypothetical protein
MSTCLVATTLTVNVMNQQMIAIAIASMIAASATSVQVQAAPIFPPSHLFADAQFAPPDLGGQTVAITSWYRPEVKTEKRPTALGVEIVAEVEIAPWYRAAN